jgi:hypothetical protein
MSPPQATSPCRFPTTMAAHPSAGCDHGGTRNRSTSRSVQTWSVSPAAMAGVQGRHCLAEPVPLVGSGCAKGWRKLPCGKQKLWYVWYKASCCRKPSSPFTAW